MTTIDLEELVLEDGAHSKREDGVCLMEAVAWFAGERHSDKPKCACPVLSAYGRTLNDRMLEVERNRFLKQLIPLLVGTRSTPVVELARAEYLIRETTRRILPIAMDAVGLREEAKRLRALPDDLRPYADAAAYTARAAARAAEAAYAAHAAARAAEAAYAAHVWGEAVLVYREAIAITEAEVA